MSTYANAVVTAVSPLFVAMEGDEAHPIPALPTASTATVGDRLRVEVRRGGLLPIVVGTL